MVKNQNLISNKPPGSPISDPFLEISIYLQEFGLTNNKEAMLDALMQFKKTYKSFVDLNPANIEIFIKILLNLAGDISDENMLLILLAAFGLIPINKMNSIASTLSEISSSYFLLSVNMKDFKLAF